MLLSSVLLLTSKKVRYLTNMLCASTFLKMKPVKQIPLLITIEKRVEVGLSEYEILWLHRNSGS